VWKKKREREEVKGNLGDLSEGIGWESRGKKILVVLPTGR
jgi:hypothetical protein